MPVETLREHFRDQVEASSLRKVAERAGIGRTTLANFVSGETSPHPRVRRSLALLYLVDGEAKPPDPWRREIWSRPEVQLAARVLHGAFKEAGETAPDWLKRLAG